MITQQDLQALTELLNRLLKSRAETLWCQSFLQQLMQLRIQMDEAHLKEKLDETECEDCCSSTD